tara:strand:+ start:1463 stop:1717 length:255 start_codon:yes stop_codon:yes gene_type:complete
MKMEYSIKEVSKHNNEYDCWLIAHNKIYNVTDFIEKHPIGSKPLIRKAGQDCTEDYDFHSKSSKKEWEKYYIGYIKRKKSCIIS